MAKWWDIPCQLGHFRRARRIWTHAFGPIPAGKWVLHHCHVPRPFFCWTVEHLYLGDRDQNLIDAIVAGKARRKLQPDQIAAIVSMLPSPDHARELAAKFGVLPSTIQKIWTGQRHIVDRPHFARIHATLDVP